MQTAKREGMTLLNQELTRYVKEDIVEVEEAYFKSVDKGDLLANFKANNIQFQAPDEAGAESE